MFKKITLKNFKSFKELNDLELNDLTIIVGKNSCGKSSIIQSLLLLKQTLESDSKTPLNVDGRYLKFSDLKEITFGVPAVNAAKIDYLFHFESNSAIGKIAFSFKNKKSEYGYLPVVDSFTLETPKSKEKEDNELLNSELENTHLINYGSPSASVVKKLANSRIKRLFDENKEIEQVEFLFETFIPHAIKITTKNGESTHSITLPVAFIQPNSHNQLLHELTNSIKSIKYLSPIRATPERAYMHYSQDAHDLLENGSNSAHILYTNQNKDVYWLGKKIKLKDAVNECLKLIGLEQTVSPDRIGDILYKIGIKENCSGSNLSLTDVGFGYSQILPVILLGLLNEQNNLLLVEQPEIHLHPSSAANLADLFLSFVKDNKKILIETHSQELINRLRLRVIQNPELKNKINIVFVESNPIDGSSIKQFKIDENGMFPEWPDGFLDESEKIAQAILEARLSRM